MCKSYKIESFVEPLLRSLEINNSKNSDSDKTFGKRRADVIVPSVNDELTVVDVITVDVCKKSAFKDAKNERSKVIHSSLPSILFSSLDSNKLPHFCGRSRFDGTYTNSQSLQIDVGYVGKDRVDSLGVNSPHLTRQLHRDTPSTLSQYTKVAKVGSGASGEVWLCLNSEKQEVAMKIIPLKRHHGCDLLSSQTLREIAILRKLDYPNILHLQDYVVDPDARKIYIVTEFCDMGPLIKDSDIGSYKPLPPAKARKIFGQIVAGLHYIHSKGIAHNDIKPSNILLSRSKDASLRVVIADFGILSRLGGSDSTFKALRYPGEDDFSDGTAADICALGVCLYVLCFGRSPWGDVITRDGLKHTLSEYVDGQRILEVPAGGDEALEHLIRSMLHPDPYKRATIKEILVDPWLLADTDLPAYFNVDDNHALSISLSRTDIDNAVTVVSNIDFETRVGSDTWSAHLSEAQRNLLVFHSAINLLNLCTKLMDLAGAHCSPNRSRITEQLLSWTSSCCEMDEESADSNDVCFTSLQFGLTFIEWSKALEEDVVSSIDDVTRSKIYEFKMKQLDYVKNKVLPILKQRIQELVLRLKASEINPNHNIDCVGPWRYFKANNICNNFKAVFDAISHNPDSSSRITFICNGQCVLKPPCTSLPVHTIHLDVGISDVGFSDHFCSSSGDEMVLPKTHSSDKELINPVYLPAVAVDILRDLICNSRKYSPPGTVIRAAELPSHGGQSAGIGMDDPEALVQFGATGNQERRGFGRGFGLTKCYVTVTSFLNGTFSVTSLPDRGTCIQIAIPVPEEAKVNIDTRPPWIFCCLSISC
ncbi:hypothetical protein GEMRC1_001730 [Eukaryota sp. GEM-RC1]